MNEIISHNFPNMDCLKVYPIGDVHIGSLECREAEWKQFCDRIAEEENSRLILCGDLLDTGITGSKTNVYNQAYTPMQQKQIMCEYLEPIKDKILCVVEGNHERRVSYATSYSPTLEICSKLDIEDRYCENGAVTVLRFGKLDNIERRNQNGSKRPTYTLYISHGRAKTRDVKVGYYIEGVDVTVSGHTHEPNTLPKMRYKVDLANNKIVKSPFVHITVGSWLNWGGYGQYSSYAPPAEAIQTILLNGRRKGIDITTTI